MLQLVDPFADHQNELYQRLRQEVELASRVVYRLDQQTPVDHLAIPDEFSVWAKREDASRIHSYKWRGAFFKMYQLQAQQLDAPLVAVSAGNHAQGVAIAARKLQRFVTIFMPSTTPDVKQRAVRHFGGTFVQIRLSGDCYDDAARAAAVFQTKHGATLIQPFDDLSVIAGQATVGLEFLAQRPNLAKIYVPIGGGGLAAGIAFAAKHILQHPCQIIGVEAAQQNSMQVSIERNGRTAIEKVDTFCDGTAVQMPGALPFSLCQKLLSETRVVDNADVCWAMQVAWESGRFIPEPSGGLALAAALLESDSNQSEEVGVVVTGSNVDFRTLPRVVRHIHSHRNQRRYFRFTIPESKGALITVLDSFMADLNIVDFQYGKTDARWAHPVLGIEGPESQLAALIAAARRQKLPLEEISGLPCSEFRLIPLHLERYESPLFLRVDFPNRPGALLQLMRRISESLNICYFNFVESGELQGHALIGFELLSESARAILEQALVDLNLGFQAVSLR